MDVYINDLGVYLPNKPELHPYAGYAVEDIECLCCGTSTPDLLNPGHALMVQGELRSHPCEVVSTTSICLSGMTAFKYGYLSIKAGNSNNAVTSGSELTSSFLRSTFFESIEFDDENLKKKPILAFDSDFLRWMLSDGAGAAFLSNKPNKNRSSFRIEWIDILSYANEIDTCMHIGGQKQDDGSVKGWRQTKNLQEAVEQNYFSLKQDIDLLNKRIIDITVNRGISEIVKKRGIKPEQIDWFLPHYSSHFFREKVYNGMKEVGFEIPYEKWFSNLEEKGNTGSASIYIIMEELFNSGKLKNGDTLLCYIPESGRFSVGYLLLTVVQ